MAAHALLSPSAAERWINCPASVFLNKDIPDEGSSMQTKAPPPIP